MSRSIHYSAGSGQQFKEESFTIKPADFEEELSYDPENEHTSFPVVILMETDDPQGKAHVVTCVMCCLLYTSPSPRDATLSRMPSSA